jgi:hypothetical protein
MNVGLWLVSSAAALLLLSFVGIANADPIDDDFVLYGMTFQITDGTLNTVVPAPDAPYTVDVTSADGDVYVGFFTVDSSVLASDGPAQMGNVLFFDIDIADNNWAYNLSGNNSFVGFRGPTDFDPSPGFEW